MTQLPELPLTLSRQEIRKMIRQRRRALTPEQQQEMGQQAATRMMTYPGGDGTYGRCIPLF